jgi:hypothetical protein
MKAKKCDLNISKNVKKFNGLSILREKLVKTRKFDFTGKNRNCAQIELFSLDFSRKKKDLLFLPTI